MDYERHLEKHFLDPAVQRFSHLHYGLHDRGDRAANEAFYQCYYTESLPGLGPWYEVYPRAFFLDLDMQTFPELVCFCEDRSNILDAGCGDGLPLLHLAQRFPHASFTGVDLRPEALNIVHERAQQLGLHNVHLVEGDVFDDRPTDRFDAVILRNVVDDTRDLGSSPQDAAAFGTEQKLRAIHTLIEAKARVWVSLTPYPEYSREFEAHVRADIGAAGYSIFPAKQFQYESAGKACTHLVWAVYPSRVTCSESPSFLGHETPEQRCQL